MEAYRIYQVNAFTRSPSQGNPAGVVANAEGLSDSQMQAIAGELNHSETAFILPPTASDHDLWVRFFTPTTEVPSCGHATIAAHFVRAMEGDLGSCSVRQRIGIGILPVEIVREAPDYRIIMTQGPFEVSEELSGPTRAAVLRALRLSKADLDRRCPIQIASTGHSKVMVGVESLDTLNSLTPDLDHLTEVSRTTGCKGFFVFSLEPPDAEVLSHGRMFAPAIGISEDPVTGNANGPLGGYLVHNGIVDVPDGPFTFKAIQGEAMGRPGILSVSVDVQGGRPRTVKVGGHARIVYRAEARF